MIFNEFIIDGQLEQNVNQDPINGQLEQTSVTSPGNNCMLRTIL